MTYTLGETTSNMQWFNKDGKAALLVNPHETPKELSAGIFRKILLGLNGFNQKLGIDELTLIKNALCEHSPQLKQAQEIIDTRIKELKGED